MPVNKLYSLRFYADGPDGETPNKLFSYPIHQGGHGADLLLRFLRRGFEVKAVFVVEPDQVGQLGQRVPPTWVEVLRWGTQEQAGEVRGRMLERWPERLEPGAGAAGGAAKKAN